MTTSPPKLDQDLLDLLVCPLTKEPLRYDEVGAELWSLSARLAYPVRDGIPIMLPEEARELTDEEVASVSKAPKS